MQRELSSTCRDVFRGGREVVSMFRRMARLIWWEACVHRTVSHYMPQNHARGRRRCSGELIRQTGTGGCTRHVCICTLAALKNEPSCGSERDWIYCREPETHTDGRMGNKSACNRSTAVGSGGTVDAAKHWRGLTLLENGPSVRTKNTTYCFTRY